jgi:pimeloyl-ACP methyl ester carboxylesterase
MRVGPEIRDRRFVARLGELRFLAASRARLAACVLLLGMPALAASLERSEYLACDGAKLYLQIRGADRTAPVLLWLHGGPGAAERPLFRYFNGDLEKHFVVVYWDQRAAGRSFDPKADPRSLTIRRHMADLDCVIAHLRKELSRDKIILAGHSWGAALGLLYVHGHPDTVSTFIAVNPLISMRAQQQAEYKYVHAQALRQHDSKVLARLREIGAPPFATLREVLAMEKLVQRYGGIFHKEPNRIWVMFRAILTGLVTPCEIRRIIHANNASLKAMNQELLDLDLTRSVPSVDVPVLFLLGRHDRHADARIAEAYLARLAAPIKRVVWFENSAHNIPFEEPDLFNATLVCELRSIGVRTISR